MNDERPLPIPHRPFRVAEYAWIEDCYRRVRQTCARHAALQFALEHDWNHDGELPQDGKELVVSVVDWHAPMGDDAPEPENFTFVLTMSVGFAPTEASSAP
jgi:hypothetical protein